MFYLIESVENGVRIIKGDYEQGAFRGVQFIPNTENEFKLTLVEINEKLLLQVLKDRPTKIIFDQTAFGKVLQDTFIELLNESNFYINENGTVFYSEKVNIR